MNAIVIRHAERLKFPSELGMRGQEINEDEASITQEGRVAASECGASLQGTPVRIVTSPVRRCRETADCLAQGAGLAPSSIQVDAFLSSDFFGMLRHSDEKAKQDTVRRLLAGEIVAGFEPPRRQATEALSRMADLVKDGSGLFVTHDWWMALFLANLTPAFERHGYDIWPNFLEMCAIDVPAHSLIYRKERYSIALSPGTQPFQEGEG